MIDNTAKPAILVDLKKYRIRVHKNTLRHIGCPDYVLLLVNPEEHTLAVVRSDRSDPRSYHIGASWLKSKKNFELHSRFLVENLRDICVDWQNNQSYRLYGEIFPNEGMVCFHMSGAVVVNGAKL